MAGKKIVSIVSKVSSPDNVRAALSKVRQAIDDGVPIRRVLIIVETDCPSDNTANHINLEHSDLTVQETVWLLESGRRAFWKLIDKASE